MLSMYKKELEVEKIRKMETEILTRHQEQMERERINEENTLRYFILSWYNRLSYNSYNYLILSAMSLHVWWVLYARVAQKSDKILCSRGTKKAIK